MVSNKINYSVLTCIFKDYDILHDAYQDDSIEYICVTDNPNLKSNTWKVIIDEELLDCSPEYASFYVRYHPFKYCSTDICMRMDASIEIKGSLLPIFEEFDSSNKDICVMTNSRAKTIKWELFYWMQPLYKEVKKKQIELYKELGVDIDEEGCIQSPVSITRNNDLCNKCDSKCWNMIKELSTDEYTARPTQVIMTVAIYLTKGLDIMFVDENLIQSNVMQWYHHNDEKYRKSLGIINHTKFFDLPIKIHKFNGVHSITNEFWRETKDGMSNSNKFNTIKQLFTK